MKHSKEVEDFLSNVILPQMKLSEYNDENIDEILEFISINYEDLLSLAKEDGQILSSEQEELLRLAIKTINEITLGLDWK